MNAGLNARRAGVSEVQVTRPRIVKNGQSWATGRLNGVSRNMANTNQDVIRWSSFQEDRAARSSAPAVKRFGFMSQISPDGRYVVTSIGPPGLGDAHKNELKR